MSEGLFNPEAFEQMPGQMSMEQVESKAARELRAFCEAPTEVREAYNAQVRAEGPACESWDEWLAWAAARTAEQAR